jgi:hypothetical protein
VSVTALPATYLVCKSQTCAMLQGSLWRLNCTHCVDLAGNASFKSSGVICWLLPPSSLPGELSVDKRDSIGFFSTLKGMYG